MRYKCDECNQIFDSKQSYAGHKSGHARRNNIIHSNCSYCGKELFKKQNRKFENIYCSRDCMYKHRREIWEKEPYKVRGEELQNITKSEMEQYQKEHSVCEICGREEYIMTTNKTRANNLCVDHNHKTKNFRGLLCNRCNTALGYWESYGDKILAYLDNNYETKHVSMV